MLTQFVRVGDLRAGDKVIFGNERKVVLSNDGNVINMKGGAAVTLDPDVTVEIERR